MKRPLLTAIALFCAVGFTPALQAQTTTVTASSIKLGGVSISAGTLSLTPVDNVGNPIPFVTGGGGLNGPTAFPCTITSGAISGSCVVPDATLTTPVNIVYKATITNTAVTPHVSFTYNIVGLSGTTWALDNYAPGTSITNVQSIIGYHGTSVPGSCVAPSFFTNDTTHEVMSCVAGSYTHGPTNLYAISVALTTTSGTSDAVTVTGMTSSGHCQVTPTNSTAATNIATTYVSTKATNSVTVTHATTSGMTYDVTCTPF